MHCFLSIYHFLFILHSLYSFSILFLFHVSFLSSSSFSSSILPVLINFYCSSCFYFVHFLPPAFAFHVASSHIYFRLPVSVSTFSSFFSSLILFRSFRPFPFVYDISRILVFLLIPLLFSTKQFCSFFPSSSPRLQLCSTL